MKKIKKSTGLTLALLIYVSATAAYFLPRSFPAIRKSAILRSMSP